MALGHGHHAPLVKRCTQRSTGHRQTVLGRPRSEQASPQAPGPRCWSRAAMPTVGRILCRTTSRSTTITCAVDGRDHLISDRATTTGLAAGHGRYTAACGHIVVALPGPSCSEAEFGRVHVSCPRRCRARIDGGKVRSRRHSLPRASLLFRPSSVRLKEFLLLPLSPAARRSVVLTCHRRPSRHLVPLPSPELPRSIVRSHPTR